MGSELVSCYSYSLALCFALQQSEHVTCVTYGVGGQPCCGLEAAEMAAAGRARFGQAAKFFILFETKTDEVRLRALPPRSRTALKEG